MTSAAVILMRFTKSILKHGMLHFRSWHTFLMADLRVCRALLSRTTTMSLSNVSLPIPCLSMPEKKEGISASSLECLQEESKELGVPVRDICTLFAYVYHHPHQCLCKSKPLFQPSGHSEPAEVLSVLEEQVPSLHRQRVYRAFCVFPHMHSSGACSERSALSRWLIRCGAGTLTGILWQVSRI
jgi:hypothetical protein